MIPIDEDVIKRLQKTILLLWGTKIISRLIMFSKPRKGNIEIVLFTTQYQSRY